MGGLRVSLRDCFRYQPVHTLSEAVQLATTAESQNDRLGGRNASVAKHTLPSTSLTLISASEQDSQQGILPLPDILPTPTTTPLKVFDNKDTWKNNPYAPPMPGKCFHCGVAGHRSNQCPRRQPVALTTKVPTVEGQVEDVDDGEQDIIEYGDEGHALVVQEIPTNQKQSINIFRTQCTVNQMVCDLIIDSGSIKNLVSQVVVNKLNLPTQEHPSPYPLDGSEVWKNQKLRGSASSPSLLVRTTQIKSFLTS